MRILLMFIPSLIVVAISTPFFVKQRQDWADYYAEQERIKAMSWEEKCHSLPVSSFAPEGIYQCFKLYERKEGQPHE